MEMDEQIGPHKRVMQITQRRPIRSIARSFSTDMFTRRDERRAYRFEGALFCGQRADLIPECPILSDQLIDQGGNLFGGVCPGRRSLRRSQVGHCWVVVFEGEDGCDRGQGPNPVSPSVHVLVTCPSGSTRRDAATVGGRNGERWGGPLGQ